jgi:NAD(P)-dependent dehydrogenase (short-subunit alcohol dehydrogenase family)
VGDGHRVDGLRHRCSAPERGRVSAVIVTGGAGGIGTAIAGDLSAAGHTVAVLDRVAAAGTAESHVLDVSDEGAVTAAIGNIARHHGGVSALVCAAGLVREHPVTEMPLEDWRAVIDASLTGTFLAARAVLPAMISARGGTIVAFSSGYAASGYRNGANYAAAKAGVEALIKSIALENAEYGIRANCIAPGPIATPMLTSERAAFIAPRIPMRRVGSTHDVVGLVRFLIGDESGYVTGQTIHVNGGLLMP